MKLSKMAKNNLIAIGLVLGTALMTLGLSKLEPTNSTQPTVAVNTVATK